MELRAASLSILGKVMENLPFEINASTDTKEEVRLKYRFLDLRNKKVKDNIILRSKVISFLRSEMERLGFTEIQTPILTASSPEGARDYLVPSRKHPGKFYALPQAPQQIQAAADGIRILTVTSRSLPASVTRIPCGPQPG